MYLFTFGSFFAWGFHWLGLLESRSQVLTYIGLDIFFAVLFFIIAQRMEGAYLFAVAIPLGILVGIDGLSDRGCFLVALPRR